LKSLALAREYRVFPESQAAVENSILAIAGAAFHSEQIFTGWGLLKGGPFRFSELAGEPTSSDQVVASRRKPFFVELGDHDAIAHNDANEASAIWFWSRQNSKLGFGDPGLPDTSARMSTISRQRPRPCLRPFQRCFPSFCQASRIAAGEYFEPLMVESATADSEPKSGPRRAPTE
jgi:hypothetical protein